MIKLKGIDISHHNGDINWNKVKGNIDFVTIRAGFGINTVDTKFIKNIEGAIAANIPVSIYWFSYAYSIQQAKQEAAFCLKTIEKYKKYIKYPIWFDYEEQSYAYGVKHGVTPNKKLISDMSIAFMEEIKKSGYATGIYSNQSYLTQFISDEIKNKYDVWLAHVGAGGKTLTSTSYKGNYAMWQYSWVGKINGISGNVDLDYCYKNYLNSNENHQNNVSLRVDINKEQKSLIKSYNNKTQGNEFLSDHFQIKEFACSASDEVKIDNRLIWILERLFKDLNCKSIIINSGYRTPAYSIKVGGSSTDKHTTGQAADIKCKDKNGKFISAKDICIKLSSYGDIFGIGYINETSVHVDTRSKSAIWYGDESNNISLIKSGYCDFNEYFNGKQLLVNDGTWNIRIGAGIGYKSIGIVHGKEKYIYTKQNNGWAYIPKLKGWLSKSGYKELK